MRDTSLIISLFIFAIANLIQAVICICNFFANVNNSLSQIYAYCSICFSELFAKTINLLFQTSRLQTFSKGYVCIRDDYQKQMDAVERCLLW